MSTTLRVATYNIHSCVGTDGRHDPERVAAVLDELDADAVGLQEVAARPDRTPVDQFAYLARATGMAPIAQPLVFEGGGHYGNMLLSRLGPLAARRLDLSQPAREPRGAIEARLDLGGGRRLRFVTTHLGLSAAERARQVARLLDVLDHEPHDGETVMAGDFNEWSPLSPRLRRIRRWFGAAVARRPPTFPARLPVLALDRIWSSPGLPIIRLAAHRSELARRASDHLPVIADLRLAAADP